MKLRIRFPDGQDEKITEIRKSRVRVGRDTRCDLTFDAAAFPKISGLHAELVSKDGQVWLVHRSKSNSTVMGEQPIQEAVRLKIGDRFRLGFTGPEIELVGFPIQPGNETVFAGKASDYIANLPKAGQSFDIESGGVIGRGEQLAKFLLPHPHVSRRHAMIKVVDGRTIIGDLKSSNGTYLNGQRLTKPTQITPGGVIDIGPFSLTFDGSRLLARSRANNIRLDVEQVSYVVADNSTKRQLNLLNDVTFRVDPGQFIAVLGPSGSGKSTLLKIISGRNWPFTGRVKVNSADLHQHFSALKEDLVVIPQTAAFHEALTVRQTIHFAASLRLPGDTDRQETRRSVEASLLQVGLLERAETRVGALSGGQLKRLALACELISDPSLLFLDEVTSGLDEQADRDMMSLFRSLADTGKTLVCVTHNLSHVEEFCHKILVLTVGGRVAFFGMPNEACDYFGVKKLADIYPVLATKQPQEWHAAFLNSDLAQSINSRKLEQNPTPPRSEQSLVRRVGLKPLSQTAVLTKRCVTVWLGDRASVLAMFGQAALVTLLLCLVFNAIPGADESEKLFARQNEIRSLLFLIGISCFWLGANNAAKEIVRERTIYERERNFNLVPEAFWASKVFVLSLVGFLQSGLLTLAVTFFCDLPGDAFALLVSSLGLSFLGTNLGLAISAHARSAEFAVMMVPVLVIPQIILADVVNRLTGASLVLAKLLMTSFWGQKLFENVLPETDRIASDFEPTTTTCVAILLGHLVVYAAVAWIGVRFFRLRND